MPDSASLAFGRCSSSAATRRAFVKLSGLVKFSRKPAPYDDAWPFVAALIDAFTLDHCLWASDWPYLRAPVHVDYGVLLRLALMLFPDAAIAASLLWDTPRELWVRVVIRVERRRRACWRDSVSLTAKE